MKKTYVSKRFRPESMRIIRMCDDILAEYMADGYRMTLRQLYYKLVSANVIPNSDKSYKNVGALVSDARLAGLLDWDAVEDRVRVPKTPPEFSSLGDLVEAAISSFRLPRRTTQESHVELWVEKDALAGVLLPIARRNHITLCVNKGYSSQTAMRDSALRFIEAMDERSQKGIILYIGDHDPSGEDMVRDIRDRMEMFGAEQLVVKKVALTMAQIEEYDPPPNPAKITDPRAGAYIEKHGDSSWEVDALPPDVLNKLIEAELKLHTVKSEIDRVVIKEERGKRALRKAAEQLEEA